MNFWWTLVATFCGGYCYWGTKESDGAQEGTWKDANDICLAAELWTTTGGLFSQRSNQA